ncbi:class I SAM-dependent methyltransferase [Amaricoccus solimangrovi]|nr:class I SAM-dependent methyltransferase [Amaricoccus solimangrovi]
MSVLIHSSLDHHADFYDAGLGPVLLEGFAADLAWRAAELGPRRILELAAGTGVLTRALRARLPGAALTVTDIDAAMLARARASMGDGADFELADCAALPFADAAFDLAVCQFGVALFPRKTDAFQEVARVVRPGGTYLFNCWGPIAANPYARIAGDAIATLIGHPPESWTTPHAYADPRRISLDLRAAGWCRIDAAEVAVTARVADPEGFARGLVLGSPVSAEIRAAAVDPAEAVAAVARALTAAFGPPPFAMPLAATVHICHTP